MNRKILVQVTAPAVVIGLVLFGACLVGARSMSQLQENRAKIISEHFNSMEAAQQLEILFHQMRFRCLLYLLEPVPARLKATEDTNREFKKWLQEAKKAATTEEEKVWVAAIDSGYDEYHKELIGLRDEFSKPGPQMTELERLEKEYPIRHIIEPCHMYFNANKQSVIRTNEESNAMHQRLRAGMFFLGLGGPLSGLIIGYGVARGLSRSIYQLRVRVHDITQRLEQNVASVSLAADGDLHGLDQQMQNLVRHVAEVTERLQQQQREMLRAEQLSAVGQLAASVAHEVRNPLTSVKLLVEAALRSRNSKALSLADLEVIQEEVLRLEQTVRSFLDFARPPAVRRVVCDLRQVAAQSLDLVRPHARQQNVELAVRGGDAPLPADVDRGQLGTVLVNLFLNALDAMPHGGRLEVELEPAPEEGAGAFHELRVRDTGIGIAADMFPRLFTPFASSKPTGTGLGLSICRRIVEEHGGQITAANRPEGGACFTLTLPALPADPEPEAEDRNADLAGHRR